MQRSSSSPRLLPFLLLLLLPFATIISRANAFIIVPSKTTLSRPSSSNKIHRHPHHPHKQQQQQQQQQQQLQLHSTMTSTTTTSTSTDTSPPPMTAAEEASSWELLQRLVDSCLAEDEQKYNEVDARGQGAMSIGASLGK
jgi:hypothetical protein